MAKKKMGPFKLALVLLMGVLGVCCAGVALSGCSGDAATADGEQGGDAAEAADTTEDAVMKAAEKGEVYYATINVDGYGTIEVELMPEVAPKTVANFVKLANEGFYDGLTFHRIIDGFMIQGGDPKGNGTGGSGTNIVGEFSANGIENNLSHTRGVISMARAQDMNSASSQFFIMHADAPYLDGQYAAFGKVVSGMDVVDAIVADAQPVDGNGTILAANQPKITSITIEGPVAPK